MTTDKQALIRHKFSISPKHLDHRSKVQLVLHCQISCLSWNQHIQNSAVLSTVGTPSLRRHKHTPSSFQNTTSKPNNDSTQARLVGPVRLPCLQSISEELLARAWVTQRTHTPHWPERLTQYGWGLTHRWVREVSPSLKSSTVKILRPPRPWVT